MKSFPKLQRQPTDCFDELEDDALQQVMQGLTVPRTGISSIIDKLKQTGCLDEDEPPHQSDSPGMASLTPKLLLQATEDDDCLKFILRAVQLALGLHLYCLSCCACSARRRRLLMLKRGCERTPAHRRF